MEAVTEKELEDGRFFITRQTANLLEDFASEIRKGSSLYLLYGGESVGKSRLLKELMRRGIQHRKFCLIDFKPACDPTATESTTSSADIEPEYIKDILEAADERDIIIADHFELATEQAKHQLFQSWSEEAEMKKINLIIAANTGSFSEIRQMAQQYKSKILSFQLMPCSTAEIEAFLSFYLFPSNPLQSLVMPADIEKQLQACHGLFTRVIELADRQGGSIRIEPETVGRSNKPTLFIGVLATILLAIGLVIFYWLTESSSEQLSVSRSERTITLLSDSEAVISIGQTKPEASAVESDYFPDPVVDSTELTANAPIEAIAPEELPKESPLKPGGAESGVSEATTQSVAEIAVDPHARLRQELDDDLEWIKNQDKSRATIQLMTFGFNRFTGDEYHRYLNNLIANNLDVSGIRIYQTRLNNSEVYSVIYGDYEDRREASRNLGQLPDALNVKNPIPRTFGGILDEIESQNQ